MTRITWTGDSPSVQSFASEYVCTCVTCLLTLFWHVMGVIVPTLTDSTTNVREGGCISYKVTCAKVVDTLGDGLVVKV